MNNNEPKKICMHYAHGKCKFGKTCTKDHESVDKLAHVQGICVHFLRGNCWHEGSTTRTDCPYRHKPVKVVASGDGVENKQHQKASSGGGAPLVKASPSQVTQQPRFIGFGDELTSKIQQQLYRLTSTSSNMKMTTSINPFDELLDVIGSSPMTTLVPGGNVLTANHPSHQQQHMLSNVTATMSADVQVASVSEKSPPVDVFFFLDVSSSMKGSSLAAVQAAAKEFYRNLRGVDGAALYTFDKQVTKVMPIEMKSKQIKEEADFERHIDNLKAHGQTALWTAVIESTTAVRESFEWSSKKKRTRFQKVVLLTDGDDTASKCSHFDAIQAVRDIAHLTEFKFYLIAVGEATRVKEIASFSNDVGNEGTVEVVNAESAHDIPKTFTAIRKTLYELKTERVQVMIDRTSLTKLEAPSGHKPAGRYIKS